MRNDVAVAVVWDVVESPITVEPARQLLLMGSITVSVECVNSRNADGYHTWRSAHFPRHSFYHTREQWMLHFEEKGGKSREIPVRDDLESLSI